MYEISFEKPAENFLKKLDNSTRERIIKKIDELKFNPKKGKFLIGTLAGLRCLRIGDYRAIYTIIENKLIVVVLDVGHRKNVY